jgi:hypothetical protein
MFLLDLLVVFEIWANFYLNRRPRSIKFLLAYFSILKKEAKWSSETPMNYRTTRCHIPKDRTIHSQYSESPRSNSGVLIYYDY